MNIPAYVGKPNQAMDRRPPKTQKLNIAGSQRLEDLLSMLPPETRVTASDVSFQALSERKVDELLTEIDALDAAAKRWCSTLGVLREAVETHGSLEVPVPPPGLCEADDEYWYL